MKTFIPLLLLLASTISQAEIYKWIDENGKTHFGESIPDKYKNKGNEVTVDVNVVKTHPTKTVETYKNKSAKAEEKVPEEKAPTSDTADEPPKPKTATTTYADECTQKWQHYEESKACFEACGQGMYGRLTNSSGVNISQCGHCKDAKRPSCRKSLMN